VVGGGSSGLGLAVATQLAANGCDLLLWARNGPTLEESAAELRGAYPDSTVHTYEADAELPDAAAAVAEAAERLLGGVDILVLNAGGPPAVKPDATDSDAWRRALQLLTITPIELATRLLPAMRRAEWGRVIAVLSSGVREPLPELPYSNGGRAALAAWLKNVAGTVAADGVTVNGVLPGRIDTARVSFLDERRASAEGIAVESVRQASWETIPMGRYGRPEEFGSVVGFLASDAASYVTGTFVSCDGGLATGRW
jgi:3-oxoacyl-[acyl-carrier protein] reductase